MPVGDTRTTPVCAAHADLFQDPILEEPPAASAPAEIRRRYAAVEQRAESMCYSCPLMVGCLYTAVVEHDVAGFVGGTTARQRSRIRQLLGVKVEAEDFDALAGVTGHNRQVDHDEVVRLRKANPHESLERVAARLGCSLSTVKRHLRQARAGTAVRELGGQSRPYMSDVLTAAATVREASSPRRRAAA